jgi:hypothetical protein
VGNGWLMGSRIFNLHANYVVCVLNGTDPSLCFNSVVPVIGHGYGTKHWGQCLVLIEPNCCSGYLCL